MLALALAVDGLSSLIEGWAVWRRRPWAPWLIVVATGSLIPIEVALLFERPTPMKVFILAVNVATVVYMVHLRRTLVLYCFTLPHTHVPASVR